MARWFKKKLFITLALQAEHIEFEQKFENKNFKLQALAVTLNFLGKNQNKIQRVKLAYRVWKCFSEIESLDFIAQVNDWLQSNFDLKKYKIYFSMAVPKILTKETTLSFRRSLVQKNKKYQIEYYLKNIKGLSSASWRIAYQPIDLSGSVSVESNQKFQQDNNQNNDHYQLFLVKKNFIENLEQKIIHQGWIALLAEPEKQTLDLLSSRLNYLPMICKVLLKRAGIAKFLALNQSLLGAAFE